MLSFQASATFCINLIDCLILVIFAFHFILGYLTEYADDSLSLFRKMIWRNMRMGKLDALRQG